VKRLFALLLAALALGSCAKGGGETRIYLQRFFGECGAEYGGSTDIAHAEGECGIITTMVNAFNASDGKAAVDTNVIAWPGYPQLTAQMAARDPPDIVSMHENVISDYASKGLLEPVEPYLRAGGLTAASFTRASREGVTIGGRMYGLPWDTHGGLWHINTGLFAKAGLMRGGKPVLPNSPEELLAQARQFRQRTGKPYLLQSLVGDPAGATRNLYTYVLAQGQPVFPDARHLRVNTPEGRRVGELFRQLTAEGLGTSNMDTPAAIAAFMNGEGGIFATGTWMIGQFQQESVTARRPLFGKYAVMNYPRLWGEHRIYVGGHAWVVPARERTPEQKAAIGRFFRFMAAHNYDWARTGHLPAFTAVLDSPQFRALPHRADIAALADIGRPMPGYVRRQSAVEGIVGEEMSSAVTGQKSVPDALAAAERRVDEFLAELD